MGMAASQARLLTLTSRLHDIELKAQGIESQKLALATRQDELYQDYCEALDATSIQVAFMNGVSYTYQDANFTNLCTYSECRKKQYALRDNSTGNLIVTEEAKAAYDSYGSDKYSFAWAMIGMTGFGASDYEIWTNPEESGAFIGYTGERESGVNYEDLSYQYADGEVLHMSEVEAKVYEANIETYPELKTKYEAIEKAETRADKQAALVEFRDTLYDLCDTQIFEEMNKDKSPGALPSDKYFDDLDWTKVLDEFKYYLNLWEAINNAGGCQVIEPTFKSGDDGKKWFNNMVEAGLVTIQIFDDTGSKNKWTDTSVVGTTSNNFLQTGRDKTDLAKIEAEYQHELNIINRKDTKFDTELSKLETERSAITTEMDAIKQVKDDNVDRTFGIFS